MFLIKKYLLIVVIMTMSDISYSQTCCSGGVPIASSLGMPQGSKGTWQTNLSYDFLALKTLKNGTSTLDDHSRTRITQSILFQTGYAFNKRISTDLFISYVKQERTIEQFEKTDYVSTKGIGDAAILIKYALSDPEKNKLLFSFAAGPKIPTGKSDFAREDGIPLNADLQPGSGSWDAIFWINAIYKFSFRPTFNIANTVIYSLKGKNNNYLSDQTYQFGDEFQYIFSFNDNYVMGSKILDASIIFRYRKAKFDRFNDFSMPNTGGDWLFLALGLGFQLTQNLAINTTFEIPLYANVEGTQLSPTYRWNMGVFLKLNKKNELLKL